MTEFIRYIKEREIGWHGKNRRTTVSDNITALRTSGATLAKTPLNSRSTYLLRLSNDSKLIAAAHANLTVAIYSASSGSLVGVCEGHERSPWTLAFHPSNSTLLASGCLGGTIRLWSLQRLIQSHDERQGTTPEPSRLVATRVWKQAGAIASLAFHPQHPILIVAWTQEVVFYDWVSGRTLSVWKFVSDHSRVHWVNLSPDGNLLYTATANPPDSLAFSLRQRGRYFVASPSKTSPVPLIPTVAPTAPHEMGSVPATHCKSEIPPLVSRQQLLNFLLRQPNSWFQQRTICRACSLRLCKWAGTLDPFFPNSHLNPQQGLLVAQRAAILAAQDMRREAAELPFTVEMLVQSARSGEPNLCIPYLLGDPNPTAVAVIEDLPAKEFLLSRGTYCRSGSPGVFARSGICCGGHSCDLVLIHRELMRNSLCRPCLQAFWRWANETVDWWKWDAEDNPNLHSPTCPALRIPASCTTGHCSFPRTPSSYQMTSQERCGPPPPVPAVVVGMCVNCSIDVTDSSHGGVCQPSSENISQTSLFIRSAQLSVVQAALSLIRKRMRNVHEVTRVTYLAPGIINDVKLSQKLSWLLRSSSYASTAKELDLPPNLLKLLQSQILNEKRELEAEEILSKRSKYAIEDVAANSSDAPPESDQNCQLDEPMATVPSPPPSPGRSGTGLAAEAVHLATFLDVSRAAWNKPPPVRIVSASENNAGGLPRTAVPSIFDFVHRGSRLLHLAHEAKLGAAGGASSSKSTSQTSSVATDTPRPSSLLDNPGMAACCKCGRIVPYTIPVGPQSSVNEAICASLLFPAGYPLSSTESSVGRPRQQRPASPTSRNTSSHGVGGQESPRQMPPSPQTATASSSSSSPHGGVFSMLNQANSQSVLTSMQQGITNVMAGVLTDMGDHASACSLQDTTYRICRWELQLCGPVTKNLAPDSSSSVPASGPCLPMPLNVAVSYCRNSLVVPDVRIFNDSSICLSPDGNLLGAFVAPHSSSAANSVAGGERRAPPTAAADSLLAVFRLTPSRRRGQCIYMRKFVNAHPVCLDFSPNGNMLAVGLAATGLHHSDELTGDGGSSNYRMAFESSRPSSGMVSARQHRAASHSSGDDIKKRAKLQPVARIFKISWSSSPEEPAAAAAWSDAAPKRRRCLRNVSVIPHPRVLPPAGIHPNGSVESWYRTLLLAPNKVSLNTLVWCPHGGIVYGTTKGLVVMVRPQSLPDTDNPSYSHADTVQQLLSDDDNSDRLSLKEADSSVNKRLFSSQQPYRSSPTHLSLSSTNT